MKSLDVLWQLPVGCDFSGFFVEILTLIQPLVRVFDFRLDIGSCSDTMLKVTLPLLTTAALSLVYPNPVLFPQPLPPQQLLQPNERTALLATTSVHSQRHKRQQPDVLIQHGDPSAWPSGVLVLLCEPLSSLFCSWRRVQHSIVDGAAASSRPHLLIGRCMTESSCAPKTLLQTPNIPPCPCPPSHPSCAAAA